MSKTVLIVEDESNIRELLRMYLEQEDILQKWHKMVLRAYGFLSVSIRI